MDPVPDILIFLGRFHALVVHLPIGFICLALLVEVFFRKNNNAVVQPLVVFIWLLAALSATVSVVMGYFLSLQGGYDGKTLGWHKWAGISLAILAHVCYFLKRYPQPQRWTQYFAPLSIVACAFLLVVTGHFGGSLTHGSGYLSEYQPKTLAQLIGRETVNAANVKIIETLDSADIFADAIMPILQSKCVSCHNAEKKKGSLVLLSYDDMLKGGEDGPAVVPGNLEKSGLYYRISLPEDHKKFMPTDGKKPLTEQQVAIIKWWIEKQAPREGKIPSFQPDSAMRKIFTSYLQISNNKNKLALTAAAADPAAITALAQAGFQVSTLAGNSNLLQATLLGAENNPVDFKPLTAIKDQLVWLKISSTGIKADDLLVLGQLINLRKLTLTNNNIAEQKISALSSLSNLEYLNLYETKLSGQTIESLLQLNNLKQLYLGGIELDSVAIHKLSAQHPAVTIVFQQPNNELPVTDSLRGK